ncbi:transcriptional regulator [Faecalibacterium sp. An58]|uniref:metal-dependent transcriptional regulator n=1 Tax=Faecalibacterium sp. An58 TaxID=1965648 RepID=UPI000B390EE6|nr:metal-dependent transcriptional regulator [Faecalibacterium sp. An58]OUN70891.1 transcriptional regulator [Faecalibacterium sp. An58]
MTIHQSAEDYLETILMLTERQGKVRSIDVVNELGFTKASVSIAMKKLRENGYIAVDGEGNLSLLPPGREIAERIYSRHRLLTHFFIQLGVDEKTAAADACKAEHILSEVTLEKIRECALLTDAENSCKDADKTDS